MISSMPPERRANLSSKWTIGPDLTPDDVRAGDVVLLRSTSAVAYGSQPKKVVKVMRKNMVYESIYMTGEVMKLTCSKYAIEAIARGQVVHWVPEIS